MTSGTWVAVARGCAAATLLAVTGCGGDDADDPAPEPAPAAGSLRDRVVEAVTPVSGASLEARRWLEEQLFRAELPAVVACLAGRGREDVVSLVEQDFAAKNRAAWNLQYPEPDRLLAEGFHAEGEVSPLDDWTGLSEDEVARATEAGGTATQLLVGECFAAADFSDAADEARELQVGLADGWATVELDVWTSDPVVGELGPFGECLAGEGVPGEYATGDPRLFFQWADSRLQSATGAAAEERERADARIYVECGRSVFDVREHELLERREAFVEEHEDRVDRLVAVVESLEEGS